MTVARHLSVLGALLALGAVAGCGGGSAPSAVAEQATSDGSVATEPSRNPAGAPSGPPSCSGSYTVTGSTVAYSFTANTRGIYSVYLLPPGDDGSGGVSGDQDSGALPAPGSAVTGSVQASAAYGDVVVNINAATPDITCRLRHR